MDVGPIDQFPDQVKSQSCGSISLVFHYPGSVAAVHATLLHLSWGPKVCEEKFPERQVEALGIKQCVQNQAMFKGTSGTKIVTRTNLKDLSAAHTPVKESTSNT